MEKIEVVTREKYCELIHASVSDDSSGIHLRLRDEDGNIIIRFSSKEVWGRIPEDKNPRIELQKVANLLNGYIENSNGDREPIPNFVPKKIKLIEE